MTRQERLFQPHSIVSWNGPIEQGLGDFKADEALVCSGGIAALAAWKDIERELRPGVGRGISAYVTSFPNFTPAPGRTEERPVDSQWVAIVVRGVVRQRSKAKRVLVKILDRGSG